jgi:hypothetical protein
MKSLKDTVKNADNFLQRWLPLPNFNNTV